MSYQPWHNTPKTLTQGDIAMAKNMIQFQKGVSLPNFITQYGTEEQCQAELFKLRWSNGFICPKCGHTKYCTLHNRNLFQCYNCRHQTSVISDTIFDSTKLPLTKWFLGLYFVTQAKNGISSLDLARLIGVSANAALRMKHKLQQVMKERDDSQPLSGNIQIDDCYWGGERHDGKRGRGAPDKMPFIAAVSTTEEGHPLYIRFSRVTSFTKEAVSNWAKQHLTPGSNVLSDGLNCFPGVVAAQCEHEAVVTGGGPKSVARVEFQWLNTIIGNVKNSLHGTYHSVSKKHFCLYLAEFCYRFNRRFQLDRMITRLAYVALRTSPMPEWLLVKAEL